MQTISLDELIALDRLISDEERLVREVTRRLVAERYLSRAGELFEKAEFHDAVIQSFGENFGGLTQPPLELRNFRDS